MRAKVFKYEAIADKIGNLIHDGSLRPGEKVPSLRKVSQKLGVSLTSAMRAYHILEGRGLIEAMPKSGFFVKAGREGWPAEPEPPRSRPVRCLVNKGQVIASLLENLIDPSKIYFGCASPHPSLLPIGQLKTKIGGLVRQAGETVFQYEFPPGCEPLRRQLAIRSIDWHCGFSPNDLVITTGATDALNLSLRAITQPGDAIAIESPTYFGVLQTIENLRLRAIPVPAHPRDGMDLDLLEPLLKKGEVKGCLLMPNFNNPLGSLMPDANKRRLANLAARYRTPIIEDDIYGDVYHQNPRPRPLKAFDREDWVLLCSGFSKTLAPGLRVGWVASERYKETIKQLQFMSTLASVSLTQYAVADLLESGQYDRHLRGFRKTIRQQVALFSAAISDLFPRGTKMSRPRGGFVLWIALPEAVDSLALYRRALAENISFVPGPLFSPRDEFSNFIRISCGLPWSEVVEEKLALLGRLCQMETR